ncbi:MAG: EAL domain-containing response regulator [Gammaproteobacteria bacterium]|nr:EAL domain-containing response regulator [Gammaproteobacteria bacterium]
MKKVYIIDDDSQIVEILTQFVGMLGFEVASYTSAVKFFVDYPEDEHNITIMLDLNMPEMDGIEVIRQLAERGSHASLLLISGYDTSVLHSAEKLAHAHNLKIISSLTKPISFSLLEGIFDEIGRSEEPQFIDRGEVHLPLQLSEFRDALVQNQLTLHYQPQVNIQTRALVGVEALVRWQHPQRGLIFPNHIIPMAEEFGLMGDLTAQVINKAVNQSYQWQQKGLNIPVSVNISAESITSLTFPEQLTDLLKRSQFDPSMLALEVTESELMGDLKTSLDILTRLRMKGVDLSIDDFGTGYSSLSQLHRIPFTELKIDRSFVMDMSGDGDAMAIVKTCIMLGHELKMKVVAEGVESEHVLNQLSELGCDIAQGYYIARPMSADKLVKWIKVWEEEQRQGVATGSA